MASLLLLTPSGPNPSWPTLKKKNPCLPSKNDAIPYLALEENVLQNSTTFIFGALNSTAIRSDLKQSVMSKYVQCQKKNGTAK